VLGYLDGALAPFIALALLAAGRGQPVAAGALLALAALIKPTALIVAPALLLALLHPSGEGNARRRLVAATLSGLGVVALALVPFALEGTLTTAFVHCYRILAQSQLSGGYPNLWWLVGHALNVAHDRTASLLDAADHARIELLPVPAQPLGFALFALAALKLLRSQPHGPRAAALAGAGLLAAYGLVAVGVHENHVHPMFLLLLLTGLPTPRLVAVFGASSLVFVLGMLCQSGVGRLHGRFAHYKPFLGGIDSLRMAPGFDLSLALAALNLLVFGYLVHASRVDRAAVAEPASEASGGAGISGRPPLR
jgi:hypothetical protein